MNVNTVAISGNLTRDPELRSTSGGTAVCSLGVGCNGRKKDQSGNWVDDPNFFDVVVWGRMGENCAEYLRKGSRVMIQGRLNWSSWEKDGQRRSKVEIVAAVVQFPPKSEGSGGGGSHGGGNDLPADTGSFEGGGFESGGGGGSDYGGFGGGADDDIPF